MKCGIFIWLFEVDRDLPQEQRPDVVAITKAYQMRQDWTRTVICWGLREKKYVDAYIKMDTHEGNTNEYECYDVCFIAKTMLCSCHGI